MPPPNTPDIGTDALIDLFDNIPLEEEAALVTDHVPQSPRLEETTQIISELVPNSGSNASRSYSPPPNSPQSTNLEVELESLKYVTSVDENLICPICRGPLVDPVHLQPCNHTFCRKCIVSALEIHARCPSDRVWIHSHSGSFARNIQKPNRIIVDQLDSLIVECDYCQEHIKRSMIQDHMYKYCGKVLVHCAGSGCPGLVSRKLSDLGCLHQQSDCPDCGQLCSGLQMEKHRGQECQEREFVCEVCGEIILRCRVSEHLFNCKDLVVTCKWRKHGCEDQSMRKDLDLHYSVCPYKIVGPVLDAQSLLISGLRDEVCNLRNEVNNLKSKDQAKGFQMQTLEAELERPRPCLTRGIAEQLLLNFDSQRQEIDGLTDRVVATQEMLVKELVPIKEEVVELRSAYGVMNMHVQWLMNMRKQETQRRAQRFRSNVDLTDSVDGDSTERSNGSNTRISAASRLSRFQDLVQGYMAEESHATPRSRNDRTSSRRLPSGRTFSGDAEKAASGAEPDDHGSSSPCNFLREATKL